MSLSFLAPSLRCRLGCRPECLSFAKRHPIRQHETDVDMPPAAPIWSNYYGHRYLPFQRWRGLLAKPVYQRLLLEEDTPTKSNHTRNLSALHHRVDPLARGA